MVKPEVEKYIAKHDLNEKVTRVCYDLYDKKECPNGVRQYDIDILPAIPGVSRFCFGVTEDMITPDGMYCYTRDIIKGE
jgi:hypothetical protein